MQFASPASGGSGDRVSPADLEGHVLVVEPLEHVPSVTTSFGEKDAIRVTIHDVTAGATHEDQLWFGGALIGACKPRIGQRILAVLGKGTAKPGQAAPWVLVDCSTSEQAVAAATQYLSMRTAATLAAPAPAPASANALDAALSNLAAAGLTK